MYVCRSLPVVQDKPSPNQCCVVLLLPRPVERQVSTPAMASRSGSVSPDTVKRWTDSIRHVLATCRGRKHFRDYLHDRNFPESSIITLWEMCHELVSSEPQKSWLPSRKQSVSEASNICNEAQQILNFVEQHVALDVGYLQRLYAAIESQDCAAIQCQVWEVKEAAAGLLEAVYGQFCRHLLRQQGLWSS